MDSNIFHDAEFGFTAVRRARASDGVGSALRDAYAGDAFVPDELTELLKELDACGDAGRVAGLNRHD